MRRLHLLIVAVAVIALGGAACGSDDGSEPDAQPAPGVTVFAEGEFGSIPVIPLSEPAGTRSEQEDVVAQSFRIRNTSTEAVFSFYRDALEPEWTVVEDPHPLGGSEDPSFRAIWSRGDRRLIVTVAGAAALDDVPGASDDPSLQYSLSLEPQRADTFERGEG